jgi:hypothetical protein
MLSHHQPCAGSHYDGVSKPFAFATIADYAGGKSVTDSVRATAAAREVDSLSCI